MNDNGVDSNRLSLLRLFSGEMMRLTGVLTRQPLASRKEGTGSTEVDQHSIVIIPRQDESDTEYSYQYPNVIPRAYL